MAFVIKTAKTLRNHWKKSTFAAIALMYGFEYTKEYYEAQALMRVYCEKAAKYGQQPIKKDAGFRNITLILNPSANRRKASDEFDKYCAPILHLAGIGVNVIKTESEGHARNLIKDLEKTDAIVVAGGDGTFSEVITGLLRRTQEKNNGLLPLGVLPLGQTNSVGKLLFPGGQHLQKVRALADATMAVVEDAVRPIDVIRIQVFKGETGNKPIYGVAGIKWGAYRDAEAKKDSYWLYGRFRKYATYLFNGYKSSLTWKCEGSLIYTPPCSGCSNCVQIQEIESKWFQKWFKKQQPSYLNVMNPECSMVTETDISTVDFNLYADHSSNEEIPKLKINIGPKNVGYFDFLRNGWRSENGESREIEEVIEARTVEIKPKISKNSLHEEWMSIDNENYELKHVKVSILPKFIQVFCKKPSCDD